jgi:hypothetical protein
VGNGKGKRMYLNFSTIDLRVSFCGNGFGIFF